MYDILELNSKVLVELREIAHSIGVSHVKILKKPELIFLILNHQPVRIKASVKPPLPTKNEIETQPAVKETGKNVSVFYSIFKYFRNLKLLFFSLIMICVLCLTANASVTGEKNGEKIYKIFPNPIERNALVTIEMLKYEHDEMTVFLYNTVGKIIHTTKTVNGKVEFVAPNVGGIYLIRILEKQKVVAVEKMVVKE